MDIYPSQLQKYEFFVDGDSYFRDLSDQILRAKDRIYIAGLMISPDILLRRDTNNELSLLEALRRARALIYVIIWKPVFGGYVVDTGYKLAKRLLLSLGDKVKVKSQRFNAATRVSPWTYHQKIIVIDTNIAYIGGIDLAWNRWDTQEHTLVDDSKYPNKDFYGTWEHTIKYTFENDILAHNPKPHTRTPWHDIQVLLRCNNEDIAAVFTERWTRPKKFSTCLDSFPAGKITKRAGVTGAHNIALTTRTKETIMESYIELIGKAETLIYIENQYFSSAKNKVIEALRNRLKENKDLRVIIVLPMYPDNGDEVAGLLVNQREAIALFEPYSDRTIFCSLFKAEKLREGIVKGSQIYVHSKIMIVDSKYGIVGSTNLNLRSLRQGRDEEIAVVFKDPLDSLKELQENLWEEHLGEFFDNSSEITLPLSDILSPELSYAIQAFTKWELCAKLRTPLLQKVFGRAIASDEIKKIVDKDTEKSEFEYENEDYDLLVQSNVVYLPKKFLAEESNYSNFAWWFEEAFK